MLLDTQSGHAATVYKTSDVRFELLKALHSIAPHIRYDIFDAPKGSEVRILRQAPGGAWTPVWTSLVPSLNQTVWVLTVEEVLRDELVHRMNVFELLGTP